jgi:uncharacterized membrane protein YvlD (DUF360 family)
MSEHNLALRLATKAILNIVLVWAMATYMTQFFEVEGGYFAYVVIGSLLTLLNFFVRPLLYVIALPFKLFATILGLIIVNGLFIQFVYEITQRMDQTLVFLEIHGGFVGWIAVACSFGIANWLMKVSIK